MKPLLLSGRLCEFRQSGQRRINPLKGVPVADHYRYIQVICLPSHSFIIDHAQDDVPCYCPNNVKVYFPALEKAG